MKNFLLEKEIEKVTESVRICKLNIQNQEKGLLESSKKAAAMQIKMASINSLPLDQREELTNICNQLKCQTTTHKGLILEFQSALNLYENRLKSLKSDAISDDL